MSDPEEFVNVDVKTLRNFIYDVMCKLGVPEDDAQIVADVLIESDKRGIDSHGIARLKMYYDRLKSQQQSPTTELIIEKETLGTAVMNANNGMGQVAAKRAMELAIEKAKKVGTAMVVVGHSNHFGIAGYYTNMATSKGMIGMCGTNARPSTAPTWGVDPLIGTNPFSIAIPTDWGFPWSADQATSTTQRGKIETYARLDKEVIPGWVIGADGRPRTNPQNILDDLVKGTAALTPLGGIGEDMAGYKGYNYATFVEVLSSVLQQSSFLRACSGFQDGKLTPFDLGHFFIAINIEAFIEQLEF